jgi:hypothetical protein
MRKIGSWEHEIFVLGHRGDSVIHDHAAMDAVGDFATRHRSTGATANGRGSDHGRYG